MLTRRLHIQPLRKLFLVLLLVVLALQGLGMNGLTGHAASFSYLQGGIPTPMPLSCGTGSTHMSGYCNIQIVLMIDDSSSMLFNDKPRFRNQGAVNVVNILADQYYAAAQSIHDSNPDIPLPDLKVAVIHFSDGVKKESPWISLDPTNVDGWKTRLSKEINWPENPSPEWTSLYGTSKQPKLQYTTFSGAFADAKTLLSEDVQAAQEDCTRRAVMLFTDGTPETLAQFKLTQAQTGTGNSILDGMALDEEMKKVLSEVSTLQSSLPQESKAQIFITSFKGIEKYEKPWTTVIPFWENIVNVAGDTTPEDKTLQPVTLLEKADVELPARMDQIIASLSNLQREAKDTQGSQSLPPMYVPSFVESVRFTLYNSDTAANIEITGPDGNIITLDTPIDQTVTGQSTPIQVWQLNKPQPGLYRLKVKDTRTPGILTWLLAYKGLSAQFDNPPGSFKPDQPGDLKFRLFDSDGNVISEQLKLTASVSQAGEQETPLATPRQDGDLYTVSWTPKNSEAATFKLGLSNGNNELLNCSLELNLIGPTPTPTFTPTSTATSTSPATPTDTPTATPTGTATPIPLIPVIAIFPQCVPPGETVTLPMSLQYGGRQAGLSLLDWQGSTVSSSDNQAIKVNVTPLDADRGVFQIAMGPVSQAAKSVQLHLIAKENADTQPVQIFDVASTIPVSTACNPAPIPSCTTGLWATWFWPLVIVLLGLLILLLVLRFRPRNTSAGQQVDRRGDWHLLFWPLLVLLLLLLLVRGMGLCYTVPPWLFLVSILVWMIFAVLIRFFYRRDPSRPRPWWLLLLFLALAFLGYLTVTYPNLSLLWLLLVLLLAWIILWYIDPDPPAEPVLNPEPVPPFDFSLVIGPASELRNGSVTVPVQVISRGNDAVASSLRWDVKNWNITATAPGRELSQIVQGNPGESGTGSLIISDIEDEIETVTVVAQAEVGAGDQWTSTLHAAATIQIMHDPARTPVPIPVPLPVHELVILNLDFIAPCASYNEIIMLPFHLEYHGKQAQVSAPTFIPSARVDPAGEVEAKVEPDEGGAYQLIIGPIEYDKENPARKIHVQLRAEIKLGDGRSVEAVGRTTIQVCPPDDLTDLEGIGEAVQDLLYANNIFTFKQLAHADHRTINEWLNLAGWKMMDSKTWPQQAKLAEIAREYRKEDKENYEAYKAWLKDGIEPDEHDKDEKDRRPTALVWNQISRFTPVVLRLALNPERMPGAITFPMLLRYEGDGKWLLAVEWEVTATDEQSGQILRTEVTPIQGEPGRYDLRVEPDAGVREIHLVARAHINGRSVEIYDPTSRIEICYSPDVIIVPVPPPLIRDDLTELEGIGTATEKILNARGVNNFQQLAAANTDDITNWLNEADLKMMDPKTWPQQAELADIAKRYEKEEDRKNYESYKAWLRIGIEPDEYDTDEKERRTGGALVWNRIAESTPVVFDIALGSLNGHDKEAIVLPIQLNREEDRVRLSNVDWRISAKTLPGGKEAQAMIRTVNETSGTYELVIDPIRDEQAREVQVILQALVNGRSIEIYYGKAISVWVSPPPARDDLTELEGIGKATERVLNENGVFTFEQLARTDKDEITAWLNAGGLKMLDPKTWPQQAKLADIAKKYTRDADKESYEAYKAWLQGGIEPDEYDKAEKDRRPVALVWPLAPDAIPDPLEELEGIGKDVARALNDKGIFTFKQLARTDVSEISAWLDECGYQRMDPKTWPQQAKLASIVREFGSAEDRRSYEAYKAWLKGGIEPDEYKADEKERRPVALVWHGTGELTEQAYPEIFKK